MRIWQFWWRTLTISEPPRLIEGVMILLSGVLGWFWFIKQQDTHSWPYLVLCSSYLIGSATSIWVRFAMTPSTKMQLIKVTVPLALSFLFLFLCLYILIYEPLPVH